VSVHLLLLNLLDKDRAWISGIINTDVGMGRH